VRRVAVVSALVAGAVLGVAGGIEGIAWLEDSNDSKNDRKSVPSNVTNVCTTEVNSAALDACHRSRDAVVVSRLGWVFAGVGAALLGTGIYLMPGGQRSSSPRGGSIPAKPRVALFPILGTRGGALDLRVTF
jgi:hypothetical protein